jgi:hypothetical protein
VAEVTNASAADPVALARLQRAQSRRVMICTPIARQPMLEYTLSFAETCVHLELSHIRYSSQFVIGSSNLPRARNELVARFLASDFTDLMFIDDDMGWRPEAVVRLLASDKPLIAGVGRKKVEKPNNDFNVWCATFPDGSLVQDTMGAVLAINVGTAFMKIERSVFETMIAAHPEWKRKGNDGMSEKVRANYYKFFRFDHSDDDEIEHGEDFVFCDRWRALGGSVWIDPTIWLAHAGNKTYDGCISEIMRTESDQQDMFLPMDISALTF